VADVRAGMSDVELMQRHRLSAKGLQRAFEKLVDNRSLSEEELSQRQHTYDDTAFFANMRVLARHHLVVPLPIYETGRYPKVCGMVRDITENGIGVTGILASVDEIKIFSIYPEAFTHVEPFSFKAQCRWTESEATGQFVGGFEIIEISEKNKERLCMLVQELTFG